MFSCLNFSIIKMVCKVLFDFLQQKTAHGGLKL